MGDGLCGRYIPRVRTVSVIGQGDLSRNIGVLIGCVIHHDHIQAFVAEKPVIRGRRIRIPVFQTEFGRVSWCRCSLRGYTDGCAAGHFTDNVHRLVVLQIDIHLITGMIHVTGNHRISGKINCACFTHYTAFIGSVPCNIATGQVQRPADVYTAIFTGISVSRNAASGHIECPINYHPADIGCSVISNTTPCHGNSSFCQKNASAQVPCIMVNTAVAHIQSAAINHYAAATISAVIVSDLTAVHIHPTRGNIYSSAAQPIASKITGNCSVVQIECAT